MYMNMGQYDQAEASQQDARNIFHQIGDVFGEAIVETSLADLALRRGDKATSARYVCSALKIGLETGILYRLEGLLVTGAILLQRRGLFQPALQILETIQEQIKTQSGEKVDLTPLIAEITAELDEDAIHQAQVAARSLDFESAARLLQQQLCDAP